MTSLLQLQHNVPPPLGIFQGNASNADVGDTVADNLCFALWARKVDINQLNVVTDSVGAASKLGDLASIRAARCASEVLEENVVDVDLGGVLCADLRLNVEVASIKNNRPISVVNVEVFEGDVFDVSVAGGFASPCLKTGTVLKDCQIFHTCWMIGGGQT